MQGMNSRTAATWIAVILLAGPLFSNLLLMVLAYQPRWGLARALGGGAMLGLVVPPRASLWKGISRRILHAGPTEHCAVCGYSSAGLKTRVLDSGTMPFEQS